MNQLSIDDTVKSQQVRVLDVFVIGPLMMWGGLKLRAQYPIAGNLLAVLGGTTVLYNYRNYRRVEEAEEGYGRPPVDLGYRHAAGGAYAKNTLRQVARRAHELEERLEDGDQLPAWVHSYLATSADRLDTAGGYLQGKLAAQGYGQFAPDPIDEGTALEAAQQMAEEPMNWVGAAIVIGGSAFVGYLLWDGFRASEARAQKRAREAQRRREQKKAIDRLYGREE